MFSFLIRCSTFALTRYRLQKKTDESDKNARLNILPPDNLEELFGTEKETVLNTRGVLMRWRIEEFLPVARNVGDVQLDPVHVFCAADCYLVLKVRSSANRSEFWG